MLSTFCIIVIIIIIIIINYHYHLIIYWLYNVYKFVILVASMFLSW